MKFFFSSSFRTTFVFACQTMTEYHIGQEANADVTYGLFPNIKL